MSSYFPCAIAELNVSPFVSSCTNRFSSIKNCLRFPCINTPCSIAHCDMSGYGNEHVVAIIVVVGLGVVLSVTAGGAFIPCIPYAPKQLVAPGVE